MSEKKNKYIRQYKSVITKEILAKRLFGSDTKEKFDEMIKNIFLLILFFPQFITAQEKVRGLADTNGLNPRTEKKYLLF